MAWKNLQEFVTDLEQRGQLKRIRVPVDWNLEVAEIADRTMKSEGPALLFEKVCLSSHWLRCLSLEFDHLFDFIG